MYALNWDPEDTYIFGVLSLIGSDLSRLSIYSICADLEERVSGSYTCYYKGYIYIIVNLTISGLSADELRMKMAYLIRDGLMHMGGLQCIPGFLQLSGLYETGGSDSPVQRAEGIYDLV